MILKLPALRRLEGGRLAVDARAATPPDAPLGISVDGDPPSRVALVPGRRVWLALPARAAGRGGGEAVAERPGRGERPRRRRATREGRALAAGLAVALMGLMLLRTLKAAEAAGLGLFAAGVVALACLPGWILLAWPGTATAARIAVPVLVAAGGFSLAFAAHPCAVDVARLSLLIAAGLLGCWVRAVLLPSAGSWDVDYWRTAMLQASAEGLGGAYGRPGDVPEGHFLAQLTGRESVSTPHILGRPIVVNYPPLAVALWTASWRIAQRWAVRLEPIEAEALATKLASLAGDFAAVAVLLWVHRRRPWRAATLAALYWATPVSWLSSAAQGYQDGAYAPLLVIALAAAAGGHALAAGAALGVAAMIKLPALLAAPAVAGALIAGADLRTGVSRLAAAAGGGLLAIALAFLPFARAGTLPVAIVHVNSIWLPGLASAGSPNLWWLVGHLSRRRARARASSIGWSSSAAARCPSRLCRRTRPVGGIGGRHRPPAAPASGPAAAALAGATLFFSYAMLATACSRTTSIRCSCSCSPAGSPRGAAGSWPPAPPPSTSSTCSRCRASAASTRSATWCWPT